jgi:hypothetical protein
VSRSPALFVTSAGPNVYPVPSRAPRAMVPSHSRRPASSHRRIHIISDGHRPAERGLASFFGGVDEPSQSAAPAVGLFREEGALVRACGGSPEGGRRYANADGGCGCGVRRGGARGEARTRARRRASSAQAQAQELACRRARLRLRRHQQAEQYPRRAVPMPVRGRRAACADLRVEHDALAHDVVTPSASVPASSSELAHPPPPPPAH